MSLKRLFPTQNDHETVHLVLHRHWFDIALHFAMVTLFAFMLITMLFVAPHYFAASAALMRFVAAVLLTILWIYSFCVLLDYYLDTWILTSERIINIEQRGLFTRRISALKYYYIQDVTSQTTGIIQTFLNYGDVHVQTAGERERFIFHNIPHPERTKALIMRLHKEHHDQKSHTSSSATL